MDRLMWEYREVYSGSSPPEGFLRDGHFWLREDVLGGLFSVRMEPSGFLSVEYPEPIPGGEPPPWPYRRAVEYVREQFDREAFRAAVPEVSEYRFFFLAPLGVGIAYDWGAIPPALGVDIWDGTADEYGTLDVVERVFVAVGVEVLPTVKREVPARDLLLDETLIPPSRWADEQAAGVLIRKKGGEIVALRREPYRTVSRGRPEPTGTDTFEKWVEANLDPPAIRSLLEESGNAENQSVEAASETLTREVARRYFEEVGTVALRKPDHFRSVLGEVVLELYTGQ